MSYNDLAATILLTIILVSLGLAALVNAVYWVVNRFVWSSVKSPAPAATGAGTSAASSVVVEAEKATEDAAEDGAALIQLTENDLHRRLADAAEAGRIEVFGKLLGAGHLNESIRQKRLTEMKTLCFETGRRIARANPAIERVAAMHRAPVEGDTIVAVRPDDGRVVREDAQGRYVVGEAGQRVEVGG